MTNETQAGLKRSTTKQAVILLGVGMVLGIGGCSAWMSYTFSNLWAAPGPWMKYSDVAMVASVVGVALSSIGTFLLISQWVHASQKHHDQTLQEASLTFWAGIVIGAVGFGAFLGLKSNSSDEFVVSGIALWVFLVGVGMVLLGIALVMVRLATLLAHALRGK